MTRDAEHLRLLTIFHFVLAGIVGVTGLFFSFHIVMGLVMLQAAAAPPPRGGQPPPTFVGWMMLGMGVGFMTLFLLSALLLALAGWNLSRRKAWTFCFVVACLICTNAPLGTALGVCTILVLLRPSVKDLFAGKVVEPRDPEDEDDEPPRRRLPADESTPPREDDDRYYASR